MANAAPWLMMASTAMQTVGQFQQAEAAGAAAEFEAAQLEENAQAIMAEASLEAQAREREGRILESDAQAAMAAGGGSTTDAGAMETRGDIRADARYNALQTIYSGRRQSTGRRRQAGAARFRGETAQSAGRVRALSTAIGGGMESWEGFRAAKRQKPRTIPSSVTYSI